MSWLLKYVIKLIRVILTKYKIWILKLEKIMRTFKLIQN